MVKNRNNIPRPECKECPRLSCFIQKYCSPEWLKILEKHKTVTLQREGQRIITRGSRVEGIYFIYTGKVKVFKEGLMDIDREQIIRLAGDGDILGHRGYGKNLTYTISATALVDTVVCFFENEIFFEALRKNPEMTFNMMMFYGEELKRIEQRLRNMAQMSIREKVAEALLFINEAFGKNNDDTLNLHLSRQDIANIAGTNSEQVVRQLTNFEKEGVISKIGKHIKIKGEDTLRKIAFPYVPVKKI